MTTERLFYNDPYLKTADCTVIHCQPAGKRYCVHLDRTIFYPTGGGQPCDLGTLGPANVLEVLEEGEVIAHYCDRPLPIGTVCTAQIDWDRRFALMQQHSGEHLVSGIVHRRFGYDNVGFHMGADVITIDFSGELTMEDLSSVEKEVNGLLWQNIETRIFWPDAVTLAQLPYRSKKALSGEVRLVQFGPHDLCACCGLHVARTGEIGLVKLLSTTRFHGGSRVELMCGSQALAWLNVICSQNREISTLLSAKPQATALAAQRMAADLAQTRARAGQLEAELFSFRAQALEGQANVLLFEPAMNPDALRRLVDAIATRCAGLCAVFSGEEGNYKYAIARRDVDLQDLVKAMNARLNGRGGGKGGFAQGSLQAQRRDITVWFAEETGG